MTYASLTLHVICCRASESLGFLYIYFFFFLGGGGGLGVILLTGYVVKPSSNYRFRRERLRSQEDTGSWLWLWSRPGHTDRRSCKDTRLYGGEEEDQRVMVRSDEL